MELEKFKHSESASKLISFLKIEIAEQHKHLESLIDDLRNGIDAHKHDVKSDLND